PWAARRWIYRIGSLPVQHETPPLKGPPGQPRATAKPLRVGSWSRPTLDAMIDLKDLRENPDRYREGAAKKGVAIDIDRLLTLDEQRRRIQTEQETLRAEQNRLAKEMGPQIGRIMGQLKKASGDERASLEK